MIKLYLISDKMKWKTFKMLQKKLVKESGPIGIGFDKAIWSLNKKKKLYCGFSTAIKDDMWIGLKIPKNWKVTKILS